MRYSGVAMLALDQNQFLQDALQKNKELEELAKHLVARNQQLEAEKEALQNGFLQLREAVEEAGYDIYINGEHKPLQTHDEICNELKKYF